MSGDLRIGNGFFGRMIRDVTTDGDIQLDLGKSVPVVDVTSVDTSGDDDIFVAGLLGLSGFLGTLNDYFLTGVVAPVLKIFGKRVEAANIYADAAERALIELKALPEGGDPYGRKSDRALSLHINAINTFPAELMGSDDAVILEGLFAGRAKLFRMKKLPEQALSDIQMARRMVYRTDYILLEMDVRLDLKQYDSVLKIGEELIERRWPENLIDRTAAVMDKAAFEWAEKLRNGPGPLKPHFAFLKLAKIYEGIGYPERSYDMYARSASALSMVASTFEEHLEEARLWQRAEKRMGGTMAFIKNSVRNAVVAGVTPDQVKALAEEFPSFWEEIVSKYLRLAEDSADPKKRGDIYSAVGDITVRFRGDQMDCFKCYAQAASEYRVAGSYKEGIFVAGKALGQTPQHFKSTWHDFNVRAARDTMELALRGLADPADIERSLRSDMVALYGEVGEAIIENWGVPDRFAHVGCQLAANGEYETAEKAFLLSNSSAGRYLRAEMLTFVSAERALDAFALAISRMPTGSAEADETQRRYAVVSEFIARGESSPKPRSRSGGMEENRYITMLKEGRATWDEVVPRMAEEIGIAPERLGMMIEGDAFVEGRATMLLGIEAVRTLKDVLTARRAIVRSVEDITRKGK